jgi:hypothetical protein
MSDTLRLLLATSARREDRCRRDNGRPLILQVGMFACEYFSQVNQLTADRFAYRSRACMRRLPVPFDGGLVRFHQHVQVKRVSLDHCRAPFPA